MESFALLNSMVVGGHITRINEPDTFKAHGVSHLALKPTVATEPEDEDSKGGKRVFTSVTMPKRFMTRYEEAFREGGNVLIAGAMDTFTWERDDETKMGITCSLWAEAQNSDAALPIRTTNILTSEDPMYQNRVMAAGIPTVDPITGAETIKVDGGVILFLHNKKTEKREVIVPVFVKELPEEYGDDDETVWSVVGPLAGKPLPKDGDDDERPTYRDCVVATAFAKVGPLEQVVSCTTEPSVPF
ncbi:MAG: hypothetical protein HN396_18400 [Gemmatimonadales bacterium]|nr:hypothetical protein [Gemmatimonadales bacterium]